MILSPNTLHFNVLSVFDGFNESSCRRAFERLLTGCNMSCSASDRNFIWFIALPVSCDDVAHHFYLFFYMSPQVERFAGITVP